jgi:hypothetical protein
MKLSRIREKQGLPEAYEQKSNLEETLLSKQRYCHTTINTELKIKPNARAK